LEGLAIAMAKERVAGSGGGPVRAATVARPVACATSSPVRLPRDSGSPILTDSNPQYSPGISIEVEPPLRSRGGCSALDAFSPTFAAFDHERPAKRPISLVVEIPQHPAAGAHSPSPLESLHSFSKLPLGSCPMPSQ
jgi:hypothetical protein